MLVLWLVLVVAGELTGVFAFFVASLLVLILGFNVLYVLGGGPSKAAPVLAAASRPSQPGFPWMPQRQKPEFAGFNLFGYCPEGHYGMHHLELCSPVSVLIGRCCAEDGCNASWSETRWSS